MRKIKTIAACVLAIVMLMPSWAATTVYANSDRTAHTGQMGFFGGISEGVRLPRTTEIILQQNNSANLTNLTYMEMIWLTGEPIEWEGVMSKTVSAGRGRAATPNAGTREVRYRIGNSDSSPDDVEIVRDIRFTLNWRREGNQIVEVFTIAQPNHWRETITVGGNTFTLDPRRSDFNISILRDITPGVTYYVGDFAMRAVFMSNGSTITKEVVGEIFGYESAWSAAETQRLTTIISHSDGWQLQYELIPSVSMSKDLQYSPTQPTLISFDGNYREVMSNQSALVYVIHTMPAFMHGMPTSGSATINTFNSFEQLIAPNLSFLRGHWAYGDIRRLFAMEVLRGEPTHFQPNQGVSRGEFITMLARAIKLPLEEAHTRPPVANRQGINAAVTVIFPDVWHGRPDFAYIMAANNAGIAIGRGDGHFQPDQIIERQEAYALALRALGLSNLGMAPTPVTPFIDDHLIGDWARRDIYAAQRIGLIAPDEDGMLHPTRLMHKSEAAALINRLIEYMRHNLQQDYTENIINFLGN